jgi:hypothetical protein
MMRPGPLLLWLLFGWVVLGTLTSLGKLPLDVWLAYGGLLALGLLMDAWQLSRQPSPELQRDVAPVVPLG